MKIFYAASEVSPFIKTGGLADVAYSLPKSLAKMGHEVYVVCPLYTQISKEYREKFTFVKHFDLSVRGGDRYVGIFSLQENGVTYFFIDNEYYFNRNEVYGFWDDGERFSYFCRAIIEMLPQLNLIPDIIHLNDWHTGAAAPIFKDSFKQMPGYYDTKIIFTIHNLKYQGIFPPDLLENYLGLNRGYLTYDNLEFFGNINFMKAGLNFADWITTVSKTYAEEIKYSYYAEGLHALLLSKSHMLTGIVNGIDYEVFNPKDDSSLAMNYQFKTVIKAKKENKKDLQKSLGLEVREDVPMIAVVSRLVPNKGIDLIRFIFDELMEQDVQIVILGNGEKEYEDSFLYFQEHYAQRVSANIFFSSELANRIYAAADIFLMPSRFEPCGLGQLIAMRYGTIPVVRETGGLTDTVIPYNRFTQEGTGFSFKNYNAHELLFTIKDALYYYTQKNLWKEIIKQAMKRDSSWKNSAKEYEELYEMVLGRKREQ